MKTQTIAWASRGLALLAAFVLLMTSCGPMGAAPAVTSSGGLQAWIDQPLTGYTLPMQALTLKAHASKKGGGVQEIRFMVNGTQLGQGIPTDGGAELVEATTEWNPSVEGEYRIQAIAFSGQGQAMSEVSNICISNGPSGPCPASPLVTRPQTTMSIDGSPDPVSIGDNCDPAARIVHFTATVPDTSGAIEVYMRGYLVSALGARWEVDALLTPGTTAGSYSGTLDLSTVDYSVLGGSDGTLEYSVALLNEAKEFFNPSEPKTLAVLFCAPGTRAQGSVKAGGSPNPAWIGTCPKTSPTAIDFAAKTDIDPGMMDHVALVYEFTDELGNWISAETRVEMTSSGAGNYAYRMDVNSAAAAVRRPALFVRYRAAVVNTDNADIVVSDPEVITIKDCGGGVTPQATCSTFNNQQKQCIDFGCYYWSDNTCRSTAPQQPTCATYNGQAQACMNFGCNYWSDGTCRDTKEPTCADYTGQPKKCKALTGCYSWSDGTCSEKPEPFVPTPSCDSFKNDPGSCKGSGYCYAWSDNSCRDYPEPAPSCDSYFKPDECQSAGCTWDYKLNVCFK